MARKACCCGVRSAALAVAGGPIDASTAASAQAAPERRIVEKHDPFDRMAWAPFHKGGAGIRRSPLCHEYALADDLGRQSVSAPDRLVTMAIGSTYDSYRWHAGQRWQPVIERAGIKVN